MPDTVCHIISWGKSSKKVNGQVNNLQTVVNKIKETQETETENKMKRLFQIG